MKKQYQIWRENDNVKAIVIPWDSGGMKYELEHKVHHSPTGFEFGYYGSGPADLARSILWDYLGEEPPPALYQEFKRQFIAPVSDMCFIVSNYSIEKFLEDINK